LILIGLHTSSSKGPETGAESALDQSLLK